MNVFVVKLVVGDVFYQCCVKDCDVMLLLEGIFLYVSGGVLSWVNQIIWGFFEICFGLCFIGSWFEDYGIFKYVLLDNVVYLEMYFIYEYFLVMQVVCLCGDVGVFECIDELYVMFCVYDCIDVILYLVLVV